DRYGPIPGGVAVIDLPTAGQYWLGKTIGLPREALQSVERMLAFVSSAPGGCAFGSYLAARPQLAAALDGFLERHCGPLARVALRAWGEEKGLDVAAVTFLLDAAGAEFEQNGYLRASLTQRLRAIEPEFAPSQRKALLQQWGSL